MSKHFYFKQLSSPWVRCLNLKTVLFQVIQFCISTHFSSIWPIDRTLSGITTLGQSAPGSDGNEGVFHIPQSSSVTETSPSDYLVSYLGHSLEEPYSSAEIQSVYSTAPADWTSVCVCVCVCCNKYEKKKHVPSFTFNFHRCV